MVKISRTPSSAVIPAKAGIHRCQRLMDSGSSLCFGQNDDFSKSGGICRFLL
jgi:hypothetical protein